MRTFIVASKNAVHVLESGDVVYAVGKKTVKALPSGVTVEACANTFKDFIALIPSDISITYLSGNLEGRDSELDAMRS